MTTPPRNAFIRIFLKYLSRYLELFLSTLMNKTENNAQTMANKTDNKMSFTFTLISSWENCIWLPFNKRLISVPVTEAMTIGNKKVGLQSPIITSIVKIIPAIGALKIAAMAAAAPEPATATLIFSLDLNKRATFEPSAAPLTTTGASGPAEPPNEIVIKLPNNLEYDERNLIIPPFKLRLWITSGRPCPSKSLITYFKRTTVSKSPTAGRKIAKSGFSIC